MQEKARIDLYINDEQAKAKLAEIRNDLVLIKRLRDEAGAAGDVTGWNKLNAELKKGTREARQLEKKVIDVDKVLKHISEASIQELQLALKKANNELTQMQRKDGGWQAKKRDVQLLQAELDTATRKTKTYHGVMDRLAGGFNKYFTMLTTFVASATGMVIGFKRIAEESAKLDDVYSDVMKTTGRTREEVLDLNESFKEMDTRTAREELNMLARDAGKLSINAKKDILDFVEAGNMINVALGEDLGQDAIKQIGKMVERYKYATDEITNLDLKGQMLAVGSAINELGASSTASEPYLVAFAGRLGGVAAQANISMSAILGYASALDQDMQAVEMSATALQNFIMKLMADPAKFAKLAGLEVKGFIQLLETDANAAIKKVLHSLNEKGGFQKLIPIFQEMGLDGARAVGVLSAMAGSINKIEEAQIIANRAMIEGVSITKEYEIKNNNLQARLEKARKAFREKALALGERLSPALMLSTNLMSYMIKLIIRLIEFYTKYSKIIITSTAVIAGYTIAINAASVAFKAKYYWLVLVEKAQRLFNTAVKANPYALLAGAVAGLITWLATYTTKVKEATAAQKEFNKYLENTEALINSSKTIEERGKTLANMSEEQLERFKNDAEAELAKFMELEDQKLIAAKEYQNEVENLEKYLTRTASDEAERRALYNNKFVTAARDTAFNKLNEVALFIDQNKSKLKAYIDEANRLLNPKKDPVDPTAKPIDEAEFEKWKIQNEIYRNMMELMRWEMEATQKVIGRGDLVPEASIPETEGLDLLKELHEVGKLALKQQLADGVIDHQTYYELVEQMEIAHLETLIMLRKQLGMSTIDEENALLDIKLQNQDKEKQTVSENLQIYKEAALDAAQSIADAIFDIKRNAIRDELDEQLKALDQQQEAELKRKGLTEKQKDAINEKYRKKEAALKLDAWKKEQKAAVSQALINGALAIVKTFAYYGFSPAGIAAAAAQAIATGLQIAVIKKEKPPVFRRGGYTKEDTSDDEPAGMVHANEFVATAEAKRNPTVRPVLDAIDRAQRSGTIRSINLPAVMSVTHNGFKQGGYAPSGNNTAVASSSGNSVAQADKQTLALAMNRFADAVDKLQTEGVSGKWVYQEFKDMAAKEESAISKTA